MKKGQVQLLAVFTFFFCSSVFAKSIAVINLSTIFEKDRKISYSASAYIRRLITMDSTFSVLDQKTVRSILQNQKFQFSDDCTDISCDIKQGAILSVDFLITGAINSIDDSYFIVLKLIDVNSGELLGMVSKDMPKSSVANMKKIVKNLVSALMFEKEEIVSRLNNSSKTVKLNTVLLNSKPENVSVLVNGSKIGVTPYLNERVLSGKYNLEFSKKNYSSIYDTLNLSGGDNFKNSFKLEYSKEYKDSLRHEFFTKHGGRNTRRIVFGVATVLTAGAGLLFEYLAMNESQNAEQYLDEYSLASSDFDIYKEKYSNAEKAFDNNVKYRNIFYGITGGMLLGFFVSIPF